MTVATIGGVKPVTSDDREVSNPGQACQACPGHDACYRLTSNELVNAYKRGCRHPDARQANTEDWRRRYGKDAKAKAELGTDSNDPAWASEKPYDELAVAVGGQQKYHSFRKGAVCSVCGTEANRLTSRGTSVICGECDRNTVEAATQARIDLVVDRYSTPRTRETAKPELTDDDRLALAGAAGKVTDVIQASINKLSLDFPVNDRLADFTSEMIHRLLYLQGVIGSIARNPTYDGAERFISLLDQVSQERGKADQISIDINRERLTYRREVLRQEARLALPPAIPASRVNDSADFEGDGLPVTASGYYADGPLYIPPVPEAEPEYYPEVDELEDRTLYCQIAGHILLARATQVLFYGNAPMPGQESQSTGRILVCDKHANLNVLTASFNLSGYVRQMYVFTDQPQQPSLLDRLGQAVDVKAETDSHGTRRRFF